MPLSGAAPASAQQSSDAPSCLARRPGRPPSPKREAIAAAWRAIHEGKAPYRTHLALAAEFEVSRFVVYNAITAARLPLDVDPVMVPAGRTRSTADYRPGKQVKITTLSPLRQEILTAWTAVLNGEAPPRSMADIGREVGKSREWVRIVVAEAGLQTHLPSEVERAQVLRAKGDAVVAEWRAILDGKAPYRSRNALAREFGMPPWAVTTAIQKAGLLLRAPPEIVRPVMTAAVAEWRRILDGTGLERTLTELAAALDVEYSKLWKAVKRAGLPTKRKQ